MVRPLPPPRTVTPHPVSSVTHTHIVSLMTWGEGKGHGTPGSAAWYLSSGERDAGKESVHVFLYMYIYYIAWSVVYE